MTRACNVEHRCDIEAEQNGIHQSSTINCILKICHTDLRHSRNYRPTKHAKSQRTLFVPGLRRSACAVGSWSPQPFRIAKRPQFIVQLHRRPCLRALGTKVSYELNNTRKAMASSLVYRPPSVVPSKAQQEQQQDGQQASLHWRGRPALDEGVRSRSTEGAER